MYNILNNITITQRPTTVYPTHNKVLRLDFLTAYSWQSSWKDLISKGSVTIPKNLYYKDESNSLSPLNGTKINVGGFNSEPLLMRGDKVTLTAGYRYNEKAGFANVIRTIDDTALIFEGYISKVYSKIPIEFEVEDNMWLLKQTPLPNRTFSDTDTLEDIMQFIITEVNNRHKVNLTINPLTTTTFHSVIVSNESAAQLLNRLHSLYGFYSYFRGNELRSGTLIYIPSDTQQQTFIMNGQSGNVPADGQELEYQRKDDIVLSAVAHNTIEYQDGTCKDGTTPKTKRKRLEVLAWIDAQHPEGTYKEIETGERAPEAIEGERKEFHFTGAKTSAELAELALNELKTYYYTGLKGTFQTFGIPYVRHGDDVKIINPKQPEQNGLYKVKSVEYTGGVDGLRQKVELHYRIS